MVVLALIEQLPSSVQMELLIADSFADAEGVSQRLATVLPPRYKVIFFNDIAAAYSRVLKANYAVVHIDSDIGFRRNLTLWYLRIRSSQTKIAVYEEGLGTYRDDLYRGVRKVVLKLLGVGVYFGGQSRVQVLYIYKPDEYKNSIRAKKTKIEKTISSLIAENKYNLNYVFNAEKVFSDIEIRIPASSNCAIYLSSWDFKQATVDKLNDSADFVIVKLHPHIKHLPSSESSKNFIVPNGIPAEILIVATAKRLKSIVVYHHGSSVSRYLDNEKVNFCNIIN